MIVTLYNNTVLEGYMVAKDGSVCIKTDEVSGVVDTSSVCCPVDADELAGLSCTLIAIYDGTTDGVLLCCISQAKIKLKYSSY